MDARLPIGLEEMAFAHFHGQLDSEFRWGIEFDHLGCDDTILCLKYWVH